MKKQERLSEKDLKLIPKPETSFLKVNCDRCNNEQVIFSAAAMKVKCLACDHTLAEPQASKAKLTVKKFKKL